MILSDNETKYDLLNNRAIAKTVVKLIKESNDQPISIGIHGDWGAGKSSILEMIEEEFNENNFVDGEKYCCIRFNGWKHQDFEDAKIALMSAIVSELTSKTDSGDKAKKILKNLWKNINYMALVKGVGKIALGVATGASPISILNSSLEALQETTFTDDTSSNTEFKEFENNFKGLLKEANINKLVILIDDLDRCLPEVAISTLEAVRLFMFTTETAFVVAADESMIRYAVKKHFPDVVDESKNNIGIEFSKKYLEKLIQVPFRIPALGEVEACNYIMLLMVGSVLLEDNAKYKDLCKEGIARIQKPWNVKYFTVSDIQEFLSGDYEKVSNEVLVATQIGHLLSHNTDGNPRKIKRFINMLLLRSEIAKSRGFGAEIKLSVLAKMMLAEYYFPDFYTHLPEYLTNEGVWKEAKAVRERIQNETIESKSDSETNVKENDRVDTISDKTWFNFRSIKDWILLEPDIADIDLRPYYFACKEKIDYFAGRPDSSVLSAIIDILLQSDLMIAKNVDKIKNLTDQEAESVFEIIEQKLIEKGEFNNKPDGIVGIVKLVELKPFLRKKLAKFVSRLPKKEVGTWVTTGWEAAIPNDCQEYNILKQYFEELKVQGQLIVRKTVKQWGKE